MLISRFLTKLQSLRTLLCRKSQVKIGIIAGTNLYDPKLLNEYQEKEIWTPFGPPSDVLIEGKIGDVSCVLLPRHGKYHSLSPTAIPYRANIWALKDLGCTHVISSTACGGLNNFAKVGDLFVLNQFVDRTSKREITFYDGKPGHPFQGVLHMSMGSPFCEQTRKVLIKACEEEAFEGGFKREGTVVTIEGPRFSTRAESKLYSAWCGDVINMTSAPEVSLARELGLSYGAIALVTDIDSWQENREVNQKEVEGNADLHAKKVKKVILRAIPLIAKEDWTDTIKENKKRVDNSLIEGSKKRD